MSAIVFDDFGQSWSGASATFLETFSVPRKETNLGKYAVKPLGFVVIDHFGRTVQFRCAPSIVTDAAIDAAVAWLSARKFQRVALDYYDRQWCLSVQSSSEAAVAKLRELLAEVMRLPQPRFMRRSVPVSEISGIQRFAPIANEWRHIAGINRPIDAAWMARRHLGERFVVYRLGDDGRLYFDELGKSRPKWYSLASNLPMSEQPDPAYGKWLEALSLEVIAKNAVQLDDLDVMLVNAEGKRARYRYKRLALPIIRAGQPVRLVIGTQVDDQIDLRRDAFEGVSRTLAPRSAPNKPAGKGLLFARRRAVA